MYAYNPQMITNTNLEALSNQFQTLSLQNMPAFTEQNPFMNENKSDTDSNFDENDAKKQGEDVDMEGMVEPEDMSKLNEPEDLNLQDYLKYRETLISKGL
jgi:hypothetical protein